MGSTKAKSAAGARKHEFPADSTVHFVASASKATYVVKRCQRADGCTVEELLSRFTYRDAKGEQRRYRVADLRYDLAGGRLTLSKTLAKGREGSAAGKKTAISTIKRHL